MGREGALALVLAAVAGLGSMRASRGASAERIPRPAIVQALTGGERRVLGLPLALNRSTAAELELLPGIGPALAERIVADRARNGPFARVGDLQRVRGIGPGKLRLIEGRVAVLGERR